MLIKDGIARVVNGLEEDSHAKGQSRKDNSAISASGRAAPVGSVFQVVSAGGPGTIPLARSNLLRELNRYAVFCCAWRENRLMTENAVARFIPLSDAL